MQRGGTRLFRLAVRRAGLRLSSVGEALFHVPGVSSYRFDDYYTSDSTALPNQLYVLKDIVVTQWGDGA